MNIHVLRKILQPIRTCYEQPGYRG